MQIPTITPEDTDNGYKDVPVEYVRNPPKPEWPAELRITPPSKRKASSFYMEAHLAGDPLLFLERCLQHDFRGEFLEHLTPQCLGLMTDVAFEMTFGTAQKKMVEELALKAWAQMNSVHSALKDFSSRPDSTPAN